MSRITLAALISTFPMVLTAQLSAQTPTPSAQTQSVAPKPSSLRPFQPGPREARSEAELAPSSGASREGAGVLRLVPDGAPVPTEHIEALDDAIPLPSAKQVNSGIDGDQVTEPESGDPFFLGFAAGPYFPPAGERVDPALYAQAATSYMGGRPNAETYAFAMFNKRITPERVAELEALGARVLQFHPFYTLKLAVPATSIDSVANHPAVQWLGTARAWQKIHPVLALELAHASPNRPIDVWINLFESDLNSQSRPVMGVPATSVNPDGSVLESTPAAPMRDVWHSNGWMQQALESVGVEVLDYYETIQAQRCRILPQSLEMITELDFVQFVEWRAPAQLMHDESIPMTNADDLRNFFNGGANSRAVVGIVDSGVENDHLGLNHIFGAGWNESGGGLSAWDDACGHGSHVGGTMMGDATDNSLDGVAPGAAWGATGRLFNVRVFASCASQAVNVANNLAHTGSSYTDGGGMITPRPHVTNNSWGTNGSSASPWIGSEADPRAYDVNAYSGAQINVFAAGNNGPTAGTIGEEASAKNVITVGNVIDYNSSALLPPGSLWNGAGTGSSVGPTGDNRWKPNVVAPGRWVKSVDAATSNGYTLKFGTSMAAPHVTGMIAGMIDGSTNWAYLPERVAAQLMATAHRDNDKTITSESDAHLDTYGCGLIDGTRSFWSTSQEVWTSSAFSLSSGSSTFQDFTVPVNATKLVVVMHYVEDQSSSGASQALVNNFDLWLDQPPLTAGNNTGDWFAQQSAINNTEIRVLTNPIDGAWRWKVYPTSTTSLAYFGVTVFIQTTDASPDVNLNVSANDIYVAPAEQVVITAVASTPASSASNVFLDSTSTGNTLFAASTTLKDGAITDLMGNQHLGRDLMLGHLSPFFSRSAKWTTSWASEGIKSFAVAASGDNFAAVNESITIYVDATPPSLPPGLVSTSHAVGAWSNDNTLDFDWNPSTDAVSGVDGYGVSWSTGPGVFVANSKDTEETQTAYSTPALGSNASWYFAVKAVDNAGNWTVGTSEVGPYRIDTVAPTQPGVISSPSHTVNVQSCVTTVTVQWAAASDALSGLSGYIGVWDTSAATNPSGANNIGAGATSYATNIGSSASPRYFHLRARDNAGNLGTVRHFGPVLASSNLISTYCVAKVTGNGCVPSIASSGTPSATEGSGFTVKATNMVNNKSCLMFYGTTGQAAGAFQGGTLCVKAPIKRTPGTNTGGSPPPNNCTGAPSIDMNAFAVGALGGTPLPALTIPGTVVNCQWWGRDPGFAAPNNTQLSNGLQYTVCQ
jgi:hypothetical protein